MKRIALLALACAAMPASFVLAQPGKPSKPKNPPSPLAGQPFKPKLDPPTAAEWRTVDEDNLLVIETTKGRVLVEMVPEIAPQSVARIKELAREHFYDGLTFHRVINGFMAQGGDPKGDGSGGSTKANVPGEFTFRRSAAGYTKISSDQGVEDGFFKSIGVRGQSSDLAVMTADGKVSGWGLWCDGTAGMARAGDPDSANSQFFLMRGFNQGLEKNYTVWGRVLIGGDVVKALKTGDPVSADPDKMTSVRVATDLPAAQQPKVQVVDTSGPWVKTAAKYAVDVCDIELPARLVN